MDPISANQHKTYLTDEGVERNWTRDICIAAQSRGIIEDMIRVLGRGEDTPAQRMKIKLVVYEAFKGIYGVDCDNIPNLSDRSRFVKW
jgi:hypothetical protein